MVDGDDLENRREGIESTRALLLMLSERVKNMDGYLRSMETRIESQHHADMMTLQERLRDQVESVKREVEARVTVDRFRPIEMIGYGIATAVGTAVIFAVLGLIFIGPK